MCEVLLRIHGCVLHSDKVVLSTFDRVLGFQYHVSQCYEVTLFDMELSKEVS